MDNILTMAAGIHRWNQQGNIRKQHLAYIYMVELVCVGLYIHLNPVLSHHLSREHISSATRISFARATQTKIVSSFRSLVQLLHTFI